jgi:hypothetical protein
MLHTGDDLVLEIQSSERYLRENIPKESLSLNNLNVLKRKVDAEGVDDLVVHKDFVSFKSRKESLKQHPQKVSGFHLAKSGFFVNSSDPSVTICFCCDLKLRDWRPEDDAWVRHARWSPRCGHLLMSRGDLFVTKVHQHLPTDVMVQPEQKVESVVMATPNARNRLVETPGLEFRVEARDIKARADLPEYRIMVHMGFGAQVSDE